MTLQGNYGHDSLKPEERPTVSCCCQQSAGRTRQPSCTKLYLHPRNSVQYRYTHQFFRFSLNYSNPLIKNYFYLFQPTFSFALFPCTNTVKRKLNAPTALPLQDRGDQRRVQTRQVPAKSCQRRWIGPRFAIAARHSPPAAGCSRPGRYSEKI